MATAPIKPAPAPATKPTVAPQAAGPPLPTTAQNAKIAAESKTAATTAAAKPPSAVKPPEFKRPAYRGPSPLQAQRIDPKAAPGQSSIEISFLTGVFKGQVLKIGQWLGVGIEEVSNASGASWEPQSAKGIRNSASFSKLNDRTFSLQLSFYATVEDISHLVENLQHLTEITGDDKNPPLLSYRQGQLIAKPVVCQRLDSTYKNPTPGTKGYHYAEVQLDFLLIGGTSSEHALGGALSPTPLDDIRAKQTDAERRAIAKASDLAQLAPCLSTKGNEQLQKLVSEDKLGNAIALSGLEPDALVQLAISGMIPKDAIIDPAVQIRLKGSLATVMAARENGVGNSVFDRKFADVLQGGSLAQLPTSIQEQALSAKEDFKAIFDAILKQDLEDKSSIFKRDTFPTAGDRLRKFGSCGLSLKQLGSNSLKADNSDKDKKTLAKLTETLAKAQKGEIKDEELKKMFGNISDAQLKAIKNGAPFVSKQAFVDRASQVSTGVGGLILWSQFSELETVPPVTPTP